MSNFINFLLPERQFKRLMRSNIEGMTGKEFLRSLCSSCSFLYGKTKKSTFQIKNDDKLEIACQRLAIGVDEFAKEKFLFATNQKFNFICVEIKNNHGDTIREFSLPLTDHEIITMTVKDLNDKVYENVGIDNEPFSMQINNAEYSPELKISELQTPIIESIITFYTKITENGTKTMSKRNNIIHEIISSESSYIKDLEILQNFWRKNLQKTDFFTKDQISLMFDDLPNIIRTQKSFLEEFKASANGDFFSLISQTFVTFAEGFKCSVNVIMNYPRINDFVSELAKTKPFVLQMEKFAKETNSRDFLSFMVTPIQRLPRYQMFIRELIKCTPEKHPDAYFLKLAQESIDKASKEIDAKSKSVVQQIRVDNIARSLQNQFQLKRPNRELVNIADVSIKGHRDNSGVFIIFNDIVVLIKCLPKGLYSVLFDAPAYALHFTNGPSDDSIVVTALCKEYNQSILSQRKIYTVIFKNKESKLSILDNLSVLTRQYILTLDHKYVLEWNLIGPNFFPSLCSSSGLICDNIFYIFGGQITQQRMASSKLMIIDKKMLLKERTTLAAGRYGHTLSSYNNKIYVIGGRTKNKAFRKMLCFNTEESTWSQPLPNGNVDLTPRYGHTTVTYKNRFYIFGGKTISKDFLNDITVFEPQTSTFIVYDHLQNKPPARSRHAAAVIDNKMYVYGGKNGKEIFGDFWIFDLDRFEWTQKIPLGDQLVRRKGHAMFAIGNTLIIFGGATNTESIIASYAVNIDSMTSHKIADVGNFPVNLKNFAGMSDRAGKFYAFGGLEKKSKEPTQAFYEIAMNSEWLKSIVNKRNTLADEVNANGRCFARTVKIPNKKKGGAFNFNNVVDSQEEEEAEPEPKPKPRPRPKPKAVASTRVRRNRRSASAVSTLEMVDKGGINDYSPKSPLLSYQSNSPKTPKNESNSPIFDKQQKSHSVGSASVADEQDHKCEESSGEGEEDVEFVAEEEEVRNEEEEEEAGNEEESYQEEEAAAEEEVNEEEAENDKNQEKEEAEQENQEEEEENGENQEEEEESSNKRKTVAFPDISVHEEQQEEEEETSESSSDDEEVVIPKTEEEKKMVEEAIREIERKEKEKKRAAAEKRKREEEEKRMVAMRRKEIAKRIALPGRASDIPMLSSRRAREEDEKQSSSRNRRKKSYVLPPPPPKFMRK